MDRTYSSLTVRTISEDERIIEGIASTPRPDRVSDVVESLGASFNLPIPFLLDHDHLSAVGEVEFAEVTATGIKFRARIKKIAEPGPVKDLCDKAWSLIRNGLRKFVSIGFRALQAEQMLGGGSRFLTWEWLELSAVTIPAQPDARITGLKSARSDDAAVITARVRKMRTEKLIASIERDSRDKRLGLPPAPHGVVRLSAADMEAGRKLLADRKAGKGVVRLSSSVSQRVGVVRL